MMGRKPKPLAIHLNQGNRSHLTKKALSEREAPEPAKGIPQIPDHLSESAKKAWTLMAEKLHEMGVMTFTDAWGLEQLSENYAEILAWRKEIKKRGRIKVVKDRRGVKRPMLNPACLALSDSEKRFRAMMEQFG